MLETGCSAGPRPSRNAAYAKLGRYAVSDSTLRARFTGKAACGERSWENTGLVSQEYTIVNRREVCERFGSENAREATRTDSTEFQEARSPDRHHGGVTWGHVLDIRSTSSALAMAACNRPSRFAHTHRGCGCDVDVESHTTPRTVRITPGDTSVALRGERRARRILGSFMTVGGPEELSLTLLAAPWGCRVA